jgi:hypothetical protein
MTLYDSTGVEVASANNCCGSSTTIDTTLTAGGTYTLIVFDYDGAFTGAYDLTYLDLTIYQLTATETGTGIGTVTSNPSGISCGSTCSASYSSGTSVTLTAAPSFGGSIFAGWSGDPGCADGIVTLCADTSCNATFDLCNPAAIAMTGSSALFGSITAAYEGAASTDTIEVVASNQQEDLVFSGKHITLQGGFGCAFTEPPASFTTITGSLTISGGCSISIGGIRIQ